MTASWICWGGQMELTAHVIGSRWPYHSNDVHERSIHLWNIEPRGLAHWQQLLINFNVGQGFVWRLSHSKYLISKHPFCRCVSTSWGAAVLVKNKTKKTVNNRSKEIQWSDGMLKKHTQKSLSEIKTLFQLWLLLQIRNAICLLELWSHSASSLWLIGCQLRPLSRRS